MAELNADIAVYVICLILFAFGCHYIKDYRKQVWSLKKRFLLRAYMTGSIEGGHDQINLCLPDRFGIIGIISRLIRTNKKEKTEQEIFASVSFLRNIASIKKGGDSTTDSVIQCLSEQDGILQPVYYKMLGLIRLNKLKEAELLFSEQAETPVSKDFVRILMQWDKIKPEELSEILLSLEKRIKEIRVTAQKRRDELISDLIYFPVIMNIILIFINFISVAYFIDQKEMLTMFL